MKFVTPSAVRGTIPAPPSKSMMGRAIAAALLVDGTSEIRNISSCDDGLTAMEIAKTLGAVIGREEKMLSVQGTGKVRMKPRKPILNCNESGLCMRMFAPIAALTAVDLHLTASGSLRNRPMEMVEDLNQLGASCETDNGFPPIRIKGPLRGGSIGIDASKTSQFLSGLLMALPLAENDSHIAVRALTSAPYVRMTLELLRDFGIRVAFDDRLDQFSIEGNQAYIPTTYVVEGDWSGASFLLVAGALAGKVTVTGLNPASSQADRAILDALELAGASVVRGDNCVTVEHGGLKPFMFDATPCPDLFPPLVALAGASDGTSVIFGADRLTHKESDRARALMSEFGKLGIAVTTTGTRMEIRGGSVLGGTVDSHNDHRIAMACAVAALLARDRVSIVGAEAVSKSYPDFFSDLDALKELR